VEKMGDKTERCGGEGVGGGGVWGGGGGGGGGGQFDVAGAAGVAVVVCLLPRQQVCRMGQFEP